ncbi:MAG: hypothetical protein RI897_611 [Verrucomicrobiota bacterium]
MFGYGGVFGTKKGSIGPKTAPFSLERVVGEGVVVVRGRWVGLGGGLLVGDDGDVADFEAFWGGDEEGGVEGGEGASGGRWHVIAVDRPGGVDFFNEGL